jgi:hypothetical protein
MNKPRQMRLLNPSRVLPEAVDRQIQNSFAFDRTIQLQA